MMMLILGIVLIRQIFKGSIYNVNTLNDKVRSEIGELFTEESRIVIYLAGNKAEVGQGESWGIAYGIKNVERGSAQAARFTWTVKSTLDPADCRGLTPAKAESWIRARKIGSVMLAPGQTHVTNVLFDIPEDAPLCIVSFDIEVRKDNEVYTTTFFDLDIK